LVATRERVGGFNEILGVNDAARGIVEREINAGAGRGGNEAAIGNDIVPACAGGNGGVVLVVGGVNVDFEFIPHRRRIGGVVVVGEPNARRAQRRIFCIRAGADRDIDQIGDIAIGGAVIDAANG